MRYSWLLLIAAIFTGCLASNALTYESKATTNQYHLARVRKGMSEKQVLQIMHKPYSYETFQADDDIYDVWFYVTRATGLDQTRMVSQNLTPLTFKNGILVGTGYNWYYYAMKAEAMELEAQQPHPIQKPTQSIEDKEFEKALRAPIKPHERKTSAPKNSPDQNLAKPVHVDKDEHPKASHPVHIEKKKPMQHQVHPPEKKQELPPNVRIISEAEPPHACNPCPDAQCGPECSDPPPLFCGQCPREKCGPDRFAILDQGMTELQVYKAFGEPRSHESFVFHNHAYDVWFYETHPSPTGKPSVVPQHLTVLTFKDAVLVSKSDEDFYLLREQMEQQRKDEQAFAASQEESLRRGPPKFIRPYVAAKTPIGIRAKDYSKIKKGMTEDEVSTRIGSPMDEESYLVDEDVYTVWFYKIDTKRKPKHEPITFKNGVVVGKNMKTYNKVREEAGHECIDCYTPAADRMVDQESEQNFNYW